MASSSASPLPILWGAVAAGGTVAALTLAAVGRLNAPPMPEHADAAFYALALVSAVATAAALALIRGMEARAAAAPDAAAAEAVVRSRGVLALAVAELPAVAAGAAAFLTGNTLALAFVVPFLAFVALTWPSADRVARWRGAGRR